MQSTPDFGDKLALSIADAVRASGLGRSTLYLAISRRELLARKVGRRTVILRRDLEQFLAALPATVSNPRL